MYVYAHALYKSINTINCLYMQTRPVKTPDFDYIIIVAKQMNDRDVTAKSTTVQKKYANSNHIYLQLCHYVFCLFLTNNLTSNHNYREVEGESVTIAVKKK